MGLRYGEANCVVMFGDPKTPLTIRVKSEDPVRRFTVAGALAIKPVPMGLFDLLFEAIDAKRNPAVSPYLTAIYQGLTEEEERMIDEVYGRG